MKVVYEQHPVDPERKAQLRAEGYMILDAKFAPVEAVAAKEAPRPARRARSKKGD